MTELNANSDYKMMLETSLEALKANTDLTLEYLSFGFPDKAKLQLLKTQIFLENVLDELGKV